MTDPFAADVAAAQAAQTAAANLQAELAADQQTITADTAQITQLQAQLAAAQQPQPAPVVFGSCLERINGETTAQALARVEAALGKLGAVRFYQLNGQLPAWPIGTAANQLPALDGRVLLYSFAYDPAQVVAGAADAAFDAFCKTAVADGGHVVWTYAHEMDVKIRNGVYTVAQYRAAMEHLLTIAQPYATASFQSAQIFTDYLLTGAKGLTFDQLYLPGVDLLGWDSYAWGPNNPADLSKLYAPIAAASAGKGKAWFIAETGADATTFTAPNAHATALTQLGADALNAQPRPLFVSLFNYGPRWTITGDPAATAAWLAGQH